MMALGAHENFYRDIKGTTVPNLTLLVLYRGH